MVMGTISNVITSPADGVALLTLNRPVLGYPRR